MRRHTIALLLGLLALSAAACSGEDDGGVASLDGDATESAAAEDAEDLDAFEQALAYSQCMRDNGVEGYPDPEQQGEGGVSVSISAEDGVDPDSEVFQAAERTCEDLMPGPDANEPVDPEVYEELLAYSECMRDNGIESFPDPEPNGGIMIDGDMGFDPQSDAFLAAEEACADVLPGGPGGANHSEDE